MLYNLSWTILSSIFLLLFWFGGVVLLCFLKQNLAMRPGQPATQYIHQADL